MEIERRRLHEAQHAQLGGPSSDDLGTLTAGGINSQDEEEEKEVDPSIVGSLDGVYKDAPGEDMKGEDPFKKVPIMGEDHEKPMKEMEKSYDAMVALVEENPGSPLPEDATNLDSELRRRPPSLEQGRDNSAAAPNSLPDLVGAVHLSGVSPSSSSSSFSNAPSLALDLSVGALKSVDLLEEAGLAVGGLSLSRPVDLTEGLPPAATFTSYS